MRIPNYNLASGENNYKQLQSYMPSDTFRMLMCGPSGCGKNKYSYAYALQSSLF